MATWRERIERLFCAAAFAEANDPDTARSLLGARAPRKKRRTLEDAFVAAAFAEASEPDLAREYAGLDRATPGAEEVQPLVIPGVNIWFGTALVAID